jgi:hypothetical protein
MLRKMREINVFFTACCIYYLSLSGLKQSDEIGRYAADVAFEYRRQEPFPAARTGR